ncbi:MAG: hypothetical protein AB1389_08025 [Campylobacterota bacterium]
MIRLENLYKQYFKIYTKTNMLKLNNKYVSSLSRSYLYLSIIFFMIASVFLIFNNNNIMSQQAYLLNSVVFFGLTFLYNKKYQQEFKQKFIEFHNLQNTKDKDIDYVFYDVFSSLKNDTNFTNNTNYLVKVADIEMTPDSFLGKPIVLILISVIVTLGGSIFISEVNKELIVKISIYLIILIIFYWLRYDSTQHFGRNKHASFKLFLIKVDYFMNNVANGKAQSINTL